jgi:aldehyde:ferredoxin oxidoreductase
LFREESYLQELGGYAGKILRIDLSKNKIIEEPLSKELVVNYIGGTGFCVKILYDETGPETDPLGPENRLIMATGPLAGTVYPASARWNVAAKSPLTGIWGEANAGGNFASELKFAGFDAIVVQGKADKPVYLWVDDGEVSIRDAGHLWGKSVWETEEILHEDANDNEIRTASIGQAGENLVYFAGIFSARYRTAARSGLGAVMGSKNLKAIAVRGSKDIKAAHPGRLFKLIRGLYSEWKKAIPFPKIKSRYGTLFLIDPMNTIGRFPTKNHRFGSFPMVDKISADVFINNYAIKNRACAFCGRACKHIFMVTNGPYAGFGAYPEYESVNALGPNLWNANPEHILHTNWLCGQYGMDTTSTGGVIGFAMELWEKGIINKKDTGGLDFSWGNEETIIKIIHQIAKREGFGNILADGVRKAAEKIGKGAQKSAMHVKGLEIGGQDGRAQKSQGISQATSARGSDHLRHMCFFDESIKSSDAIVDRWGQKYQPEMSDRLDDKYKGIMAKDCEDIAALLNSLGICGPPMVREIWFNDLAELFTMVVGIKIDAASIQRTAERIVDHRRAYNIRLGLSRKDDNLPEHFLKDPAPVGLCKGEVVDLNLQLNEYYTSRGYDLKTGLISRSRLEKLGLKYVADELDQLKKLPLTKASSK